MNNENNNIKWVKTEIPFNKKKKLNGKEKHYWTWFVTFFF